MLTFRPRNVNINQIKVVFLIEFHFEIVYRSTYKYIQRVSHTTRLRPMTEFGPVSVIMRSFMLMTASPVSSATTLPRSPTCLQQTATTHWLLSVTHIHYNTDNVIAINHCVENYQCTMDQELQNSSAYSEPRTAGWQAADSAAQYGQ